MSNKILNLDLSKDPIMPAIVYGRVGDDRLQTVTVNITRRDEIADLTGYTITFEGTTYKGQTKVFDSDNVSTTTAGLKKGTFEYTFPNMAFAVAGKYEQAYFSIVKDGKRDSTAGFEIYVDGNADIDAPEAETIITEYTKLVAELNRLQKQAIDEMDENFATAQEKISDLETEINTLRNKIDQALTDFEKGNFWTKDESFSKEQTETLIDQKSENQWTQKTDKTLGAEADMNDYKDLGTYAIGIGHRKNQPGNLGSQQGWLSVYRLSPESTVVSQTALYPDVGEYSGFTRMFTRSLINYNTNLWSPWREITRPFATTEQVLAGGVDDRVVSPKTLDTKLDDLGVSGGFGAFNMSVFNGNEGQITGSGINGKEVFSGSQALHMRPSEPVANRITSGRVQVREAGTYLFIIHTWFQIGATADGYMYFNLLVNGDRTGNQDRIVGIGSTTVKNRWDGTGQCVVTLKALDEISAGIETNITGNFTNVGLKTVTIIKLA
ncbi:BppU family phage baseplate upper protein [Enterococcus sp. 12E11_DIV0728]|uniref:BppU family phage baseplate upper protein n=1 Tax=Enterococcus sp. 12E11_DIV0728 TaxID=1834168 RepID=UPI000B73564C|nr:BppU family phage baseplate upper protein [Enterococcus sp. 12E11_DIV0728]OTO71626.1 hypothetical protein A5865_002289 [Enterococcus sp. 12E11_DIV0728]